MKRAPRSRATATARAARRFCLAVLTFGSFFGAAAFGGCVDRAEVGAFADKTVDAAMDGTPPPPTVDDAAHPRADVARATTKLASGSWSACAIDGVGAVVCWGDNESGALGDPTAALGFRKEARPVKGVGGTTRAIAGGEGGYCALLDDGSVSCWGGVPSPELAQDADLRARATPRRQRALGVGVARLAVGSGFACALDVNGELSCWGRGASGQLGSASTDDGREPRRIVDPGEGFLDVAASARGSFVCAVGTSGRVFCWGNGHRGQLGPSAAASSSAPVVVGGLDAPAVGVSAGESFACARLADGGVACWGDGAVGQLGSPDASTAPRRVVGVSDVVALTAGDAHACAVTTSGEIVCWGAAFNGQIPGATGRAPPTVLARYGAASLVTVACGFGSTCVMDAARNVRCAGRATLHDPIAGEYQLQ